MKLIEEQNYWLIIDPTVEININNNNVLLYDTSTKRKIKSNVKEVIKLFYQIKNKELVIEYQNRNKPIQDIIQLLIDNYMCYVVPINQLLLKPIQFTNIINIQNGINKVNKQIHISHTDNLISNLRELNIYLNDYNNESTLKGAYKQFLYCSEGENVNSIINYKYLIDFLSNININNLDNVSILGANIVDYYKFEELIMFLSKHKTIINLFFHIKIFIKNINKLLEYIENLDKDRVVISIFVTHNHFDEYNIIQVINIFKNINFDFNFFFTIDSINHYEIIEIIIKRLNLSNYSLLPYFNGYNKTFFNDFVFLSKEDVEELQPTQKEINTNKTVNSIFFGKININSLGNIYSYYNTIVGNIEKNNIIDCLKVEFKLDSLWFKTRFQVEPCKNCLYNIMCPPISKYELYFNKNNLCELR